MYVTEQEDRLIRAVAAAMPIRGFSDAGKAQLSQLAEVAERGSPLGVKQVIDAKHNQKKISAEAAQALRALVDGITLSEHERWRLPSDPRLVERALQVKLATALKYANNLRQQEERRDERAGGDRSRQQARRPR